MEGVAVVAVVVAVVAVVVVVVVDDSMDRARQLEVEVELGTVD